MTDGDGGGRARRGRREGGRNPATGTRRAARERALSLLYEAEAKGVSPLQVLEELPIPPEAYAAVLVSGVAEHRAELDGLIRRFAKGWALERMPVIDRNLLRLGIFELAHRRDVPTGVVISEAVELAKSFSTEESGRFVNGMLARIGDELRGPRPGRPQPGEDEAPAGEEPGDGDPAP